MANRKPHERPWRNHYKRRWEHKAEDRGRSPYLMRKTTPRTLRLFAQRAYRHAWTQALREIVATLSFTDNHIKHITRYE